MANNTQILKPNPSKRKIKQYKGKPQLTPRKKLKLLAFIESGKTARAWLKKHKIKEGAMYRELAQDSTFKEAYTRARVNQTHTWGDQLITIGDNRDGDVQRDRLSCDNRRWLMGKNNAQAYGDKIELITEHRISLIDHLKDTINVTPEIGAIEEE